MSASLDALAELERVAVYTQFAAGLTPEWASRPLLPWEVKAGINFRVIDASMRQGYTRSADILDGLQQTLVDSLARALDGASDGKVIAARVAAWVQDPPTDVVDAKAQAKIDMQAALVECADRGGEQLRREAALQGVVAAGVVKAAAAAPGLADPDGLLDEAALPVEALVGNVTQAATLASQRPSRPDAPITAASKASGASAKDLARQAVHIANGEGRVAAATQLPQPSDIYSSEILDGRTCRPCQTVDGKRYASLADAERDYPGQGSYIDCQGGARCRGTLVLVWDETAAVDQPISVVAAPQVRREGVALPILLDDGVLDQATSVDQLGQLLNRALGNQVSHVKGFASGEQYWKHAGLGELDLERTRAMVKTVNALYRDHPDVNCDFGIGYARDAVHELPQGIMGETRASGAGARWDDIAITMNPEYLAASRGIADLSYTGSVNQGWFHIVGDIPSAGVYGAVHEFGHAISFTRYFPNALGRTAWQVQDEMVFSRGGLMEVGKNISGYGLGSRMEFVAEAFSDVHFNGDEAFDLSKAMTTRMEAAARPIPARVAPELPPAAPTQVARAIPIPRETRVIDAATRTPETNGDLAWTLEENGDYRPALVDVLGRGLDYTDDISGLRSKVTFAKRDNDVDTIWRTDIYDATGKKVGESERLIRDKGNGKVIVYHVSETLDPEVQGQGFATRWGQYAEDWYTSQGVRQVELDANIDVGGFSWARNGFDWVKPADADAILSRILVTGFTDAEKSGQVYRDAVALSERLSAAVKARDFTNIPTPYELSRIGYTPGATMWAGKRGMLGSFWQARKVLR